MIYDAYGNIWAVPMTIGFRREVQHGSHEPAHTINLPVVVSIPPKWIVEEQPPAPYAGRR